MSSRKPTPCGAPGVPFSTLLADTILEHGLYFAAAWIDKLPYWEWRFWATHPEVERASRARLAWERATGG